MLIQKSLTKKKSELSQGASVVSSPISHPRSEIRQQNHAYFQKLKDDALRNTGSGGNKLYFPKSELAPTLIRNLVATHIAIKYRTTSLLDETASAIVCDEMVAVQECNVPHPSSPVHLLSSSNIGMTSRRMDCQLGIEDATHETPRARRHPQ